MLAKGLGHRLYGLCSRVWDLALGDSRRGIQDLRFRDSGLDSGFGISKAHYSW